MWGEESKELAKERGKATYLSSSETGQRARGREAKGVGRRKIYEKHKK